MIELFFGICIFSTGAFIGSYFKSLIFSSQDWKVLRWDDSIFGYRIVPIGRKLKKNEKVFMCLELDTSQVPDHGIEVGGDEW